MAAAERLHSFCARYRQPHAHGALIVRVSVAPDKSHRLDPVDQPDGAVVTDEQISGEIGDRRPERIGMAPYGDQQLMLRSRQARFGGGLFTPIEEAPQRDAEPQQLLELAVRQAYLGGRVLGALPLVAHDPSLSPAASKRTEREPAEPGHHG